MQDNFYVSKDDFESALKHVEHFYLNVLVSRDRVRLSPAIYDKKVVFLDD